MYEYIGPYLAKKKELNYCHKNKAKSFLLEN